MGKTRYHVSITTKVREQTTDHGDPHRADISTTYSSELEAADPLQALLLMQDLHRVDPVIMDSFHVHSVPTEQPRSDGEVHKGTG